MLQKFGQSFQEHLLLEKDWADLRVVDVVKSEIKHRNECLLDSGLAVTMHQSLTESWRGDCLEDDREKLGVQLADMA